MSNSNETIEVSPQYEKDLSEFASILSTRLGGPISIKLGRKYDKLYHTALEGRKCLFMVDRSDSKIYGSKSWAMINFRRQFGSLSTTSEWQWGFDRPQPLLNTASWNEHYSREAKIASKYGKRGRPRLSSILASK